MKTLGLSTFFHQGAVRPGPYLAFGVRLAKLFGHFFGVSHAGVFCNTPQLAGGGFRCTSRRPASACNVVRCTSRRPASACNVVCCTGRCTRYVVNYAGNTSYELLLDGSRVGSARERRVEAVQAAGRCSGAGSHSNSQRSEQEGGGPHGAAFTGVGVECDEVRCGQMAQRQLGSQVQQEAGGGASQVQGAGGAAGRTAELARLPGPRTKPLACRALKPAIGLIGA